MMSSSRNLLNSRAKDFKGFSNAIRVLVQIAKPLCDHVPVRCASQAHSVVIAFAVDESFRRRSDV